jgi:hypothetical protein
MEENLKETPENVNNQQITSQIVVENQAEKKKKRFNIELVLASTSLFISLSTFSITAFQTKIMQNQQKAAVWAYLEAEVGVSADGFYCDVHNKGVGAAIVKQVTYSHQGQKFSDFAELAKKIVNDSTFTYYNYSTTPINKKVFSANEKIRLFATKDMKYVMPLVKADISVEIVYTNIYGDVSSYKIRP